MKYFVFLFSLISGVSLNAQYCVTDYGAKGKGEVLETSFIQKAIDKAYASGGGKVIVPAGTYKIGTLILKDNVNLHLLSGAIILGSEDYRDYLKIDQKFESRTKDLYAKYFMIFAEGAQNIGITGSGIIHGNGKEHFEEVRPQNLRPFMIRLVNCNNINIKDVKLLESANWTLHLLGCKNVKIDGLTIENQGEGNRDGIDIDACEKVTISNSSFSTTDDSIVMKSSTDITCQDITITNCLFQMIGGSALKTGTESNGGFKNITISNCVIRDIPVHAGIELMTVDGGMLQNILIDNVTMENVSTPFFIRLGKRARPYKKQQYVNHIDDVKDISFNNISVTDAKLPASIIGLHSKRLKNISITNYTARYSEFQHPVAYNEVPFQEFDYPAAVMFKNLPAYGLYCRSVEYLHLNNVNFYSSDDEIRPPVTFDRVNQAEVFNLKAEVNVESPVAHLRNIQDIVFSYCKSINKSSVLFEEEKNSVVRSTYSNNILHPEQREVEVVPSLKYPEEFEDFETESRFIIKDGEIFDGLVAQDLEDPIDIPLQIKKSPVQLCLLMLNSSNQPQKVVIRYKDTRQEFWINWNHWGWAPISLLERFDKDEKVSFEVSAVSGSSLKLSRAYLRSHDIGFTD
ncbi:MAG: glycoside hydrolase family 28 protein [Bacteroidota bacterium]